MVTHGSYGVNKLIPLLKSYVTINCFYIFKVNCIFRRIWVKIMKVFTEMDFYRYGFLSRTNISFILLSLFHLTAYSCKCLYLTLLVRYMEVFACMHMENSASQERMNKEFTCKQKNKLIYIS